MSLPLLPDLKIGYIKVLEFFGPERRAQLDQLCLYLGTATQNSIEQVADSCPVIQVVGLPGTGKTTFLSCLLSYSNIPFGLVDCSFAYIDRDEWGTRSGPIVDTILNELLQQLVMALRATLPHNGYSLPVKQASTCERFFIILLELLEEWTSMYQSIYGQDCIFPTPVLVFDQCDIFLESQPTIFKLLSQLPTFVASSTNRGKVFCRSCEITVIFSCSAVINELTCCPLVFFNSYTKHQRITVLEKMFSSLGLPLVAYLTESFQIWNALDTIHQNILDTKDTFKIFAEDNEDDSDDDSSYDIDCFNDKHSSSEEETDSDTLANCNDTFDYISLLYNIPEYPASKKFVCAAPQGTLPLSTDASWVDYNFFDIKGSSSIKTLEVSCSVMEHLWCEFLGVLTPHLASHAISDFHELLFLIRRLWIIYIQPLLYLENILVEFLIAGDLEGLLQELRAKFEKHSYCVKLPQLTFIRHFEPEYFILHPHFSGLSRGITKFPSLLYASLNRYEGSLLSLILLLAAFTASRTPPSHDAKILALKPNCRGTCVSNLKQNPQTNTYSGGYAFSFLRWIRLCQIFFLHLGQPLAVSFVVHEQVKLLLHIQFVAFVEPDSAPTGTLSSRTKLICITPEHVISNLAQRVDLSLDFLMST